jgi:flagellar operon protein
MSGIDQISGIGVAQSLEKTKAANSQINSDVSFSDLLKAANDVTFSNHAQKRLEKRDIQLGESEMERLNDAVSKAESKGAKESLILMDQLAFIVNVQDRKVVTTVNMNQRSDGVFTQIDSVVIAQNDRTA